MREQKVDKELEQTTSESQKTSPSASTSAVKLPQFVTYPNYSQGQIFPRENIVLDRKIDNYAIPTTSTSDSRSTPTVTASSLSKKTATTTTADSAEVATSQGNQKEPINVYNTGYNTSGSVMRKRVEQGQPNQALTLFAPVVMAEDLTKVQLILCKEIKAELQTVKETIANIPFVALQKDC